MNPIVKLASKYSAKARKKRAEVFTSSFHLDENTKILDLGSENGSNIHSVLSRTQVHPDNVYIADIDPDAVAKGNKDYGFNPVVIREDGRRLPFEDGFFDIVYCSSVIEHVTVPKEKVWSVYSGERFRTEAFARQTEFAREIRRLGRQYFVQTPYKHFPIESHSWLPLVAWLPRWLLVPLLRTTNRVWIKKTSPDWNLLNKAQMRQLFADAVIRDEKSLGVTKSIMAIGPRA